MLSYADNMCTSSVELFAPGEHAAERRPARHVPLLLQLLDVAASERRPTRRLSAPGQDRACRSVNVILITDGDETCDSQADAVERRRGRCSPASRKRDHVEREDLRHQLRGRQPGRSPTRSPRRAARAPRTSRPTKRQLSQALATIIGGAPLARPATTPTTTATAARTRATGTSATSRPDPDRAAPGGRRWSVRSALRTTTRRSRRGTPRKPQPAPVHDRGQQTNPATLALLRPGGDLRRRRQQRRRRASTKG